MIASISAVRSRASTALLGGGLTDERGQLGHLRVERVGGCDRMLGHLVIVGRDPRCRTSRTTVEELGFYTLAGAPASPRDLIAEVRDGRSARPRLRASSPSGSTSRRRRRCPARSARCPTRIAHRHRGDEPQHPPPAGHRRRTPRRCTASPAVASRSGSVAASTCCSDAIGPAAHHHRADGGLRRADAPAVARRDDPRPRRTGRVVAVPRPRRDLRRGHPARARRVRAEHAALGGRAFDQVVLHTFFTDETTTRCVRTVKDAAEQAGPRPGVGAGVVVLRHDRRPPARAVRLKKTVGRMATYLQAYGDLMVRTNGWDPAVLARFRADPFVPAFPGAIDQRPRPSELEHVATLIPAEWLAPAATGTPEQCVAAVQQPVRPRRATA